MVIIKTNRLILRPVELSDAKAIFHYRSNFDDNKYQGWIPYSINDVKEFIKIKITPFFNTENTWFQFAITTIHDNRLIGDVGVHFFSNGNQVEIGCTLDKDFQHNGYATEAIRGLIDHLIFKLKKHRITASVDPRNVASIRLIERMGFKKEAYFKQRIFIRGEWTDDVIYSILKEDWIIESTKTNT